MLCSRLQATSVAIGENFPIPEIVAIGGQSDGKSSLLEAFLGFRFNVREVVMGTRRPLIFRFNVREVEMGTRRPLIVQMNHDPTAQEPRCRLQEEDSEEYGPVITPESEVAQHIMKRTETHLASIGGPAVSAKPIVMKVEFAYCPNLTIIDTPGFILKSSVEWASSLWLNVVQEVDPSFQRTIFVASKFDNRMKEFAERWEVDKYLAASGYLPPQVRPFFLALPKDRTASQSSTEWRKQMAEVDSVVFKHMREQIKGGFDEERFGSRVGFQNLKKFLEGELARRYREAAPHTLAVLHDRVESSGRELAKAETELKSIEDVASVRSAAMRFASSVALGLQDLVEGSTDPDPQQHGMTTDEERMASRLTQWPGVTGSVVPPNAGLKLFGGAAFERCLNEFQVAANALRFPSAVATDRVANMLLAYKGRNNFMATSRAAEDIARQTAKEVLGPLLDTACSRMAFVIRRMFEIAADRAVAAGSSRETL
eukprot:gene23671-9206_t